MEEKLLKNSDNEKKRRPTITEWVGVKPAPKAVGEVIRKFGKRYNLKIVQMEKALEQANKNHADGWEKRDQENDTEGKAPLAHNYIYRSWPDISQTATLDIVCEAFVAQLSKRYNPDEIQDICKRLKEEIRAVYKSQAAQSEVNIVSVLGLQWNFEEINPEYAFFIGKNLAAFSSLTETDILFWDALAAWSEGKRKKAYDGWRKCKIDYQTIISPAFQQWITLRSKDYSDSARKPRKKENPKPSKKFLSQIQKLSSNEAKSIHYILERLKKRNGSAEGKKYPLAPPLELDLLILFKYCLPEEKRKRHIEQIRKEQQKAAGDD